MIVLACARPDMTAGSCRDSTGSVRDRDGPMLATAVPARAMAGSTRWSFILPQYQCALVTASTIRMNGKHER